MSWREAREWPPHFDDWPKPDQVAFLLLRWERHQLMKRIGERVGIQSILERDIDPSTARLTKPEIAELALFLGVHKDDRGARYRFGESNG